MCYTVKMLVGAHAVTITVTPDDQVTVSPSTLVFTKRNWNVPQTLSVKAVDDQVEEGHHTGTIRHSASSLDPRYDQIAIPDLIVHVTNTEHDEIFIIDVTVTEGNSGETDAIFTVGHCNPFVTTSVDYATADGSATVADNDYIPTSGSITFTSVTTTITVKVKGDTKVEPDETFKVELSNATTTAAGGFDFFDNEALGTILNDDVPAILPTVSIAATIPNAQESGPNGYPVSGQFTVSRTGDWSQPLTVAFESPVGGTASEGADYQSLPGFVIIPAGQGSIAFDVQPLQDTLLTEGDETVTLTIKDLPEYDVATASATVTIADFVPHVSISASDPSATEPPAPDTPPEEIDTGEFKVTRDGNFTLPLDVHYMVLATSTASSSDYAALPSVFHMDGVPYPGPGVASATIKVTPEYDTLNEGVETLLVALTEGDGYEIADAGPAEVDIADVPLGSISGVKFSDYNGDGIQQLDENTLSGWTIFLDQNADGTVDQTAVTGGNGEYKFDNLVPGVYRVRESQPSSDWIQTTTNPPDVSLSLGQHVSGVNFGNFKLGTVAGGKFNDADGNRIWGDNEPGLPNWTIHLDQVQGPLHKVTTTDANGFYKFTGLGPGSYHLSEDAQFGWFNTTAPTDFTVFSGNEITGKQYKFENLDPGTYRLREVLQSGWVHTTTDPGDIALAANDSIANVDFGNFKLVTLAGQKFDDRNGDGLKDADEPGLNGWTMTLSPGGNAVTQSIDLDNNGIIDPITEQGWYKFTGVGPGTYVIAEVQQPGWTQTAPVGGNHLVEARSGQDRNDLHFGNTQAQLDLQIFDAGVLGGQLIDDAVEETQGAQTFVNLDNDDGDGYYDNQDGQVTGGDNELARASLRVCRQVCNRAMSS